MRRKTVSVLTTDVSSNALARAYLLAKLLEPEFDVHIVGRGTNDDIWAPVRSDTSIEYRFYKIESTVKYFYRRDAIARQLVTGDLIYACKPLQLPFGLALRARRILGKRLLLDIDDWELGFLFDSVYWEIRSHKISWLRNVNSPLYTRLLERKIRKADAITVSSRFLQDRYGGYWVPHARDERLWSDSLAAKYHDGPPTVMFLGTPADHKGLDLLLKAWSQVRHPTARLRIIGITAEENPFALQVSQLITSRIDFMKPVDYSDVPAVVSSAAVVAIPQRNSRATRGQLPMKLIEAMAAGRAIISTNVSDIPTWLCEEAGFVIPPDDVQSLAKELQYVLDHPQQGREMGRRARQRFLHSASFQVHRPRLIKLVDDLIAGRPLREPRPAFNGSVAPQPVNDLGKL